MMVKRDPSDRLHLPQAAGELRLPLGKRHSLNPSTHFTRSPRHHHSDITSLSSSQIGRAEY